MVTRRFSLPFVQAALALAAFALGGAGRAAPLPLELRLEVPEPFIQAGQLKTEVIVKRLPLPQDAVTTSRKVGRLSVALDAALTGLLDGLARDPVPPRFEFLDGHWVAKQHSGWTVDAAKTRRDVLNAILNAGETAPVTLTTTPPTPDAPSLFEAGVTQLVGSGVSRFAGSPPFRVTNIRVGIQHLDSLFLPQGATFSFNDSLGPTTADEGYVNGYVILGGTLALEPGGGICQVSTTVFRAAWTAGLPLVERHNHSYLVHYYDPPGLEATVYAPQLDFKFKNDTPGGLYFQWTLDTATATARLDLFGAARDRKTTLFDPVILATTPAPGPRYTADASVPLGSQWLVDNAEPGVKVYVSRRVDFPDGTVKNDRLNSNYTPWGAIWRVNPDDPRVAPPKPATPPTDAAPAKPASPAPKAAPAKPTVPAKDATKRAG
ncbi:MAG TPA: VanW family protein [Deinococcales bacterium]|nr:VanW family protein [Deinococcales bacterium]